MPPAQPTRTSRLVIALGLFAFALLVRGLYVALRGPQLFPDSETYSLADINGFNLGYALPLAQPQACNDEKTPHILRWLRAIYRRPATQETWKMGRTQMASRVTYLSQ